MEANRIREIKLLSGFIRKKEPGLQEGLIYLFESTRLNLLVCWRSWKNLSDRLWRNLSAGK